VDKCHSPFVLRSTNKLSILFTSEFSNSDAIFMFRKHLEFVPLLIFTLQKLRTRVPNDNFMVELLNERNGK